MSEFTKGKMETFFQDDKLYLECDAPSGKIRLAEMTMSYRADSVTDATELVRRWNAFEEDGIVSELVEALEHGFDRLREYNYVINHSTIYEMGEVLAKAKAIPE